MPSTTARAFDEAFSPSDAQIDRLAVLMGSISNLSVNGYCTMRDNGEALMVWDHYCAHCNAIHGHDHDGEADCIHKRALRLAIDAELAMQEQEARDDYAEMRDLQAWAAGR